MAVVVSNKVLDVIRRDLEESLPVLRVVCQAAPEGEYEKILAILDHIYGALDGLNTLKIG
jgi:hypothetical protein